MAYECQGFKEGQVLKAECLNKMEEGIKKLSEEVEKGGGGSSTLTVTIDEEGMASHTSAEIYAHVQSGGTAVLLYEDLWYALNNASEVNAYFMATDKQLRQQIILVNAEGSATKYTQNGLTKINADEYYLPRPDKAKTGQTIVVKGINANNRPSSWEWVDLPSGGGDSGIIVAKFALLEQDGVEIVCTTHDAFDLASKVNEGKVVLANISIDQGTTRLGFVWTYDDGIYVGDPWTDSGWQFDMEDGEKWVEY